VMLAAISGIQEKAHSAFLVRNGLPGALAGQAAHR
jgi:hypothetical protein